MNKPHLALAYDESIPSEMFDQFSREIEKDSLYFQRQSLPQRGPQGSLELLGLTAIALFILKPYFEGFMKEAGSDHYKILKKALHNLWQKFYNKDTNVRFLVLTSEGEVRTEYSLLFSINAQISSEVMVRFLIREDWSEKEFVAAIDTFLTLLEHYHLSHGQQSINLDNEKNFGGVILISFDLTDGSLHVIQPIK